MTDRAPSTVTGELVDRYLAGDRESERKLFEEHRAGLVERARAARWMAGLERYATPEDLVQEVFVRALSSGLLRRFESRRSGALAAALGKILSDVAVDTYRRHGSIKRGARLRGLALDGETGRVDGWGALPAEGTTPTSNARERELLDACRAVLAPREWRVWRMCEIEGRDSVAVAEELGTTAAAVRGTLLRARRKILREMASRLAD